MQSSTVMTNVFMTQTATRIDNGLIQVSWRLAHKTLHSFKLRCADCLQADAVIHELIQLNYKKAPQTTQKRFIAIYPKIIRDASKALHDVVN
ncbi:MAG: hypothetical protein V3T17_02830 [Pseudomonadales bacterium]